MTTKTIATLVATITFFSFIIPKNGKDYTPPGTVKIFSHLYMDETEITNASWLEYRTWNKNTFGASSTEYLSSAPDSTVWGNELDQHYFTHPAYHQYPVVGITWHQANRFSQWRSERVMEYIHKLKLKNPKKQYPTKINYRLPTEQEWEEVAAVGYSEKTQKKLTKKHADCNKSNFDSDNTADSISTTAPVHQYWPNKYGTYNMFGNVAEMTIKEGIAKGGSWKELETEVTVLTESNYQKPTNWVGFRCICEVVY